MDWLFFVLNPIFRYIFISVNVVALICWIATLITNNYSHVDRIWSILPPVYALVFLFTGIYFQGEYSILPGSFWSNTRLILMAMLVVAWGTRLTYNFWRKGGYNLKNEDYRWVHVQKLFNYPEKKILYHIFNLVFTAFIQIWLLVGLVLPMWFIQTFDPNRSYQEKLNWLDCILVVLFLALLTIETIADQQQWNFQTAKYEWINSQKDGKPTDKFTPEQIQNFKRGFLIHGLFSYTRHPNFCAEITMWWIFYFFCISSQLSSLFTQFRIEILLNYSIASAIVLTLLFQGSTMLTEKITQDKYPEYAKYKKRVSRLLPWFTTYRPTNDLLKNEDNKNDEETN